MTLSVHWVKLAAAKEPLEISGEIDPDESLRDRPDLVEAGRISVKLQAVFSSGVADVRGEAVTKMTFYCSRCLKPVQETVRVQMHELFTRDQRIAQAEKEEVVHVVRNEELDLAPIVLENVHLQMPLAPICNDNCEGLCPQCGQNLNEASCSCDKQPIDPRLAGLKDFFK